MSRKLQTPGATEPELTPGVTETDPNGENVSNEMSTNPESTESQDTAEPIQINDVRLDLILENQKRIESKLDQLLKAGGVEAKKKTRWVQGKHGLEQKEI
ncbi:hypothetical protein [Acinetobacter sp. Ver3]|uniref:hypothetical protein n=1 Tax=Acinetobacter sp. Ver3 TaxID=466088 RepID=UPI00044DC18F|nr:hypothetical protein [Acinetobacter sp. Ver3]EZQ12164.1 hypothetical protein CL42_02020 [Acinetobacter sp. Ver3]